MDQFCDLSGIYWKNPLDRFTWSFACQNQWVLVIFIALFVLGIIAKIIKLWSE